MNLEGHKQVVKIINSQLPIKLPEEGLLAGSVDPDLALYDSYTGIESKHHHDEDGYHGRLHTQFDIQDIVYNRCLIAREYWLAGDRLNAAFQFGVATHYYFDGFICSPSIDKEAHDQGDRLFAKEVAKQKLPQIQKYREFNTSYLHNQIASLSNSFGACDASIIGQAIAILLVVGYGLIEEDTPKWYETKLAQVLNQYEKRVTHKLASSNRLFFDDQSTIQILNHAVSEKMKNLLQYQFIYRSIIAVITYKKGPKKSFIFPLVSLSVRYILHIWVARTSSSGLISEITNYLSCDNECRTINRVKIDPYWYSVSSVNQIKMKYLDEIHHIKKRFKPAVEHLNYCIKTRSFKLTKLHEKKIVIELLRKGRDPWEVTVHALGRREGAD